MLATNISYLAMPLIAILALGAGAGEVGLLATLSTVAFLLIGLPAGAWVDRLRQREVLIVADVVRGLLLASVPVAWWLDVLTLGQLYAVTLLNGAATVFFDVASQSVLPQIVGRDGLVPANAAMVGMMAGGNVAGRGVGGGLAQLLGAPLAVACAAVGYLLSGLQLTRMRRGGGGGDVGARAAADPVAEATTAAGPSPEATTAAGTSTEATTAASTSTEAAAAVGTSTEATASPATAAAVTPTATPADDPPPAEAATRPDPLHAQIAEGLRHVLGHRELRALAFSGALGNLGMSLVNTLLPVLFAQELGLSPVALGLFWGAGGLGILLGATCARGIAARLGFGRAIDQLGLWVAPGGLLVPLIDRGAGLWLAGVGWFLFTFRTGLNNVLGVSLRQRLTPAAMLGRMNATFRFLLMGALAIGAALAGLIGEYVSLDAALWTGGVLLCVAFLPVTLSPIRRRQSLSEAYAAPHAPLAPTGRTVAAAHEGLQDQRQRKAGK